MRRSRHHTSSPSSSLSSFQVRYWRIFVASSLISFRRAVVIWPLAMLGDIHYAHYFRDATPRARPAAFATRSQRLFEISLR